jgi:hypothetical protein
MVDRLYKPEDLSTEENQFKVYFEQLISEFGSQYEVWIRNQDFSRFIAVGVLKRNSGVAAITYLKYGDVAIPNPLSPIIIEKIRHHLMSNVTEDLQINCPNTSSIDEG